MDSPKEIQLRREADAMEDAVRRYRALRDAPKRPRAPSVIDLIEPMAAAIALRQEAELRAPKPARYSLPLLSLGPDKLALLTLRELFVALRLARATRKPPAVTLVARRLGQSCRLERRFDLLRRRGRDLEGLLTQRNRNPWNARKRARRQAAEVDASDWEVDFLGLHLGRVLLDLALNHSGAFAVERWSELRGGKLREQNVIVPTEVGWGWLSVSWLQAELLLPTAYRPMVVAPEPWSASTGGGYLTNRKTGAFPLVKHPRVVAGEDGGVEPPPRVLAAVNALQETAWRIRPRERRRGGWTVLEVLRHGWDQGLRLPGLRFDTPQALPDRPRPGTPSEDAKFAWGAWWEVRKANARLAADRRLVQSRLQETRDLLGVERFYFPCQLDSRGRVYPVPQVLHPQADDMGRALLEFADGRPLGPEGERWLKIQVANTYGWDKEPFGERVRWVEDNHERIAAVARSPLEFADLWAREEEVDRPWSFLAACLEWGRFRREGHAFLSHLPVAVDGTCNGLQHLSALGRDLVGGAATNLVRSDRPSDLYQQVLDHVRNAVELDVTAGKAQACAWWEVLGREGRKAVKRAAMTTPYGITPTGIRDQLLEDFAEYLPTPEEDAEYLAKVLEQCIPKVVVSAKRIMGWLRRVARFLALADQGVTWTTPSGFRVTVEHRKTHARRIGPQGLTMEIREEYPGAPIAERKQSRSVTPNFIHSLDAAHLALTVSRLRDEGVDHCSTVHDSYAVHACHVDRLAQVLRKEFVALHRPPLLKEFLEEQPLLFLDHLPRPPRPGKLNIDEVLDSPYFFC